MTNACPLRFTTLIVIVALTACAAPVKPPPVTQRSYPASPPPVPALEEAGYVGTGMEPDTQKLKVLNPYKPITIRVTGSGAAPYSKLLTPSQRKLLALRAAKLDAFRAIAEQVQGLKLVGNSSIANMTAVNDSFRTYVDGYLRGVNVLSVTMEPDGTSRAVAEITLDRDFYKTFKGALERTGSVLKTSKEQPTVGVITETTSYDTSSTSTVSSYGSNYYVSQ